jgi:imidazolonepropionase-like amidohydrolase
MKIVNFTLGTLLTASSLLAQTPAIVLRAGTVLDGKGGISRNRTIVVQGSTIKTIEGSGPAPDYDLRNITVLPGMIDTHVHIAWHFGPDGRYQPRDDSPQISLGYAMENAYVTLMSGFTTVQSVGSPIDKDLRDAINRGVLPGPRVLTSLRAINDPRLSEEQIREAVRKMAADGADVIKIFASKSMRDGGGQTLSKEQIEAACGEAKARNLRAIVHVYQPETIKQVADAGCTAAEHGTLADASALKELAARGAYFDPNIGVVAQNYLANKARFLGFGNYTEEGMAAMQKSIPLALAVFKQALATPNLKIVLGTDAVAGAHGHNAEELVVRVRDGHQDPMAAVISGTYLAAQSLNLGDKIGTLAPGMEADIIGVQGDPLKDITALRRVVFVMKAGKVYKNQPGSENGK